MWRKHCVNYHSFSQDNDTLQLITKSTALLFLSLCSFAKQILTRMNTGRLSSGEMLRCCHQNKGEIRMGSSGIALGVEKQKCDESYKNPNSEYLTSSAQVDEPRYDR